LKGENWVEIVKNCFWFMVSGLWFLVSGSLGVAVFSLAAPPWVYVLSNRKDAKTRREFTPGRKGKAKKVVVYIYWLTRRVPWFVPTSPELQSGEERKERPWRP
jgi:hypothetical protein